MSENVTADRCTNMFGKKDNSVSKAGQLIQSVSGLDLDLVNAFFRLVGDVELKGSGSSKYESYQLSKNLTWEKLMYKLSIFKGVVNSCKLQK